MSAPENSNSKTPPSLLSDTKPAGEGGPRQSRILADLEGRVTPPAEPPRHSLKAPIAAVVALVVAVGGWGAWRMQQSSGEPHVAVAAATAPAAAAPDKAAPASGGAVQVAQNGASAASAAQPATIVNDDSASQTVASASASAASAADNSRLSRALANGADDGSGTAAAGVAATAAAAAATTKTAKADASKSTKVAAHGKTDTKNRGEGRYEGRSPQASQGTAGRARAGEEAPRSDAHPNREGGREGRSGCRSACRARRAHEAGRQETRRREGAGRADQGVGNDRRLAGVAREGVFGARFLRGSAVPLARVRRPLGQGPCVPERRAVGDAAVTRAARVTRSFRSAPPSGRRVVFGAGEAAGMMPCDTVTSASRPSGIRLLSFPGAGPRPAMCGAPRAAPPSTRWT